MERKRITHGIIAFLAIALLSGAPVWAQGMKESMKPMEGMRPMKGMKAMPETGGMKMGDMKMGGMKMPTNAPTVPAVFGYSEGQEILFIHTETSDPKIAKILTDMMGGSPVLVVPALANAPKELLAPVYVFTNGKTGDGPTGPLGGQADIFEHPPGDIGYRPLRAITLITWKDVMAARVLKSVADLRDVIDSGAVSIKQTGVVVNMPFLTWPGGKR